MEIITGIFRTRVEAEAAVEELRSLGVPDSQVGLLRPGVTEKELEKDLPVSDTEGEGMGTAMGATVGGAIGAAGGATLGAAAASLAVPGVGPVIAVGLVAATLLGVAGAATGALAGKSMEEALGGGLPHEDLYVYEEALRRGYSVVVAFAEDSAQADRSGEAMKRFGSEDIESIRESWWQTLREKEKAHYENHYQAESSDFERDELSYRHGFQAALHPRSRGKSYAESEPELRLKYNGEELNRAFRLGYERGLAYQATVMEIYKV
jgi:hypothetical protein